MTKKEYKKLCIIKVNKWTQNIMVVLLLVQLYICEWFQVNFYFTTGITIVLWIKGPKVIYWILETWHGLRHNWRDYI